ncbi:hypothetical protein [Merismopedia glauca]|uniref:Uncharacterized protein n=1 Tax=Merismopedia glauca CCAP 1448/3 TaxID=1296344 RepID=A0A2T1BWW2_9CYAN|nr:hypothetical protein [Merismopedia glauca]PSB00413.1 hypothetical protein C7B64_23685 [Merismopedia glauca CCAP 1448/3]
MKSGKSLVELANTVDITLQSLGIELNSTIENLLEIYPESTIDNALASLKEAIAKGNLANPSGFLVRAIKNGWKPNPQHQKAVELAEFNEWFPKAKRAGVAIASMATESGILVCTPEQQWVKFADIRPKYRSK